jgi:hypothetical protein
MSYDNENRLSSALQDLAGDRPYAPDVDQIETRGRKMKHRRLALRTGGGAFAAAAIAAVAVATTGTGTQAPAANLAAPNAATSSTGSAQDAPLVKLVGYLSTAPQPTGDATLVLRDQVFPDQKIDVWDLFADNGDLYFGTTRNALVKDVANHRLAEGETKTEIAATKKWVAAAKEAATGDLNKARAMMGGDDPKSKLAPRPLLSPGAKPSVDPKSIAIKDKATGHKTNIADIPNYTDNAVWSFSQEALKSGAGDPQVRAGVIKLVSQIPSVKVTEGTLKGQPTFTLTAGRGVTVDGDESLVINADSGLPIKFVADGLTVNYGVQRVTLADVAKGNF